MCSTRGRGKERKVQDVTRNEKYGFRIVFFLVKQEARVKEA